MATLQKFKLLATQCAVASSPTRSPTTSPLIHLRRRRRTLRMLLSRGGGGRRLLPRCDDGSPCRRGSSDGENSQKKGKELSSVRHKLKDLFVSSPPARVPENVREGLMMPSGGGVTRIGFRSLRPLSAAFRQRVMRRAWRPVLVAIPE